jgi:tetratricopeptide (TPR) repeat protein
VGGDGELVRGREAAGRLAWADAYAALSLADQSSSLAAEDLELLGTAAYLLGHVEDCLRALQRAQQLHAEAGDPRRAARCAFWLAFHLGSAGELAQAGGWLARANRLLEHEPPDCAERGLLLLSLAVQHIVAGDHAAAREVAGRAAGIGRHAGDPDLVALALHVQGRALVRLGRVGEAMAAFDGPWWRWSPASSPRWWWARSTARCWRAARRSWSGGVPGSGPRR